MDDTVPNLIGAEKFGIHTIHFHDQQQAIEEKSKLLKNIDTMDSLKLCPLVYHTDLLSELKDVSVYYDEKKAVEIAKERNENVKTVQTQIYRARDMLRKIYGKERSA